MKEARGALEHSAVRVIAYCDTYAEAFARLNLDWIEEYFEIEDLDLKYLEDPRGTIVAPGGEVFFVVDGDTVLGTCAMIRRDPQTYELAKMAVAKNARGRGLGKLLMETCIDYARKKGARRVRLVSNTMLEPAIRLYEKCGFKTTRLGEDPHYQRGDIEMTLELG